MTIPFLKTVILAYYLHLIFYTMTIVFLKLSVGVFLIRISNRKLHKRIIYATMAISTIWGLVTVLILIFQCGYPSSMNEYIIASTAALSYIICAAADSMTGVNAKCISGAVALGIGYSWAVVTTGSDFLFTALPLFILRDAQINKRARIVLSVLLTMGALGSVASLVRFAYVNELKEVNNNFFCKPILQLSDDDRRELSLTINSAIDEARHLEQSGVWPGHQRCLPRDPPTHVQETPPRRNSHRHTNEGDVQRRAQQQRRLRRQGHDQDDRVAVAQLRAPLQPQQQARDNVHRQAPQRHRGRRVLRLPAEALPQPRQGR